MYYKLYTLIWRNIYFIVQCFTAVQWCLTCTWLCAVIFFSCLLVIVIFYSTLSISVISHRMLSATVIEYKLYWDSLQYISFYLILYSTFLSLWFFTVRVCYWQSLQLYSACCYDFIQYIFVTVIPYSTSLLLRSFLGHFCHFDYLEYITCYFIF